ncbi:MAG: hypothetical protein COC01_08235 [Bacteroidetes bacterium]|nr:MAG: hypothetical protein COC01_08235 [Bacteroidota bacterium]
MIKANFVKRTQISNDQWNSFVKDSPQSSIYYNTWYLDSVCSSWNAIIVEDNNSWLAVMPLNHGNKFSIEYSLLPNYIQYLGVIFASEKGEIHRVYQNVKNVLNAIIKEIPGDIKLIDYNFHPNIDYLLPFYWAGYDITPRYTYWLELNAGWESLNRKFSRNVKSDIRKAVRSGLHCERSLDIAPLIDCLCKEDYLDSLDLDRLKALWVNVVLNNAGFILYVKNSEGRIERGGAFLIDNSKLIYFLASSPAQQKLGANSFMIIEAIKQCYKLGNIQYFDFEGSMIESIEHYYRGFAPQKIVYYKVSRNTLPPLINYVYSKKESRKRKYA